jgi:curved DNA-binding protein CbpA
MADSLSTQRPQPAASGRLDKTPLLHLLVYAMDKGLTGSLELSTVSGGENAAILFYKGQPAKVRTSQPVVYLGQIVLEAGLLDEARLHQTIALKAQSGKLHGQILLEARILDQAQLANALRTQLGRKLVHLLTLPDDSTYGYYDGFDALHGYGGPELTPLDPLPFIWGVIRESPPWEHVNVALTKLGAHCLQLAPTAEIARFGFDAKEQAAVDLIRSRPARLTELTAPNLLSPRVAQLLAYCLLITKQVAIVRSASKEAASPAAAAARFGAAETTTGISKISSGISGISVTPSGVNMSAFAPSKAPSRTPPPQIVQPTKPSVAPSPKPAAKRMSKAPPKDPPPELSAPLKQRWKEILERAQYIDREDYFVMLDIAKDAPTTEIQKAFFDAAKVWHPDKLPPELREVRDACARVFARMSEAHATLSDAEKRQRYMEIMKDGGGTPEAQETVAQVLEAAGVFQKGEFFFKRGDYPQAEALCRQAHEMDPTQADYLALLAWIEALKPENQEEARTTASIAKINAAIKLNAKCERAFFYRGMLHKRLNSEIPAVRDFRRAAELNPHNIDAAREVRIYEMRSGGGKPGSKGGADGEKSGGLLGKLFKK